MKRFPLKTKNMKEQDFINIIKKQIGSEFIGDDCAFLKELGIVKKQLSGIKVLGNGTLEKKLIIKAHRFTESALKKIEESGSKAEVI